LCTYEDIDRNVNRNVEEKVPTAEETSNVHQHLESRLSHEEPESVDFQVDSDVNVMEASLHVIDDRLMCRCSKWRELVGRKLGSRQWCLP
jgi:hypothetical protein